jgi:2,3-bisphosphoglycerate-dependent phosphoglycerate mutase
MGRQLALVRHGQSEYNAANRFTGWRDPPLTDQGVREMLDVATGLRDMPLSIDTIFCSALRRARHSAELVARELGLPDTIIIADAALNERDYGVLTGLDKDAARARWSEAQIQHWRRSYQDGPPDGESLRDTAARVLPFYLQRILPAVMRGQTTLVVAHGNSLRALAMALDGLSPEAIAQVEIATGELLVYELRPDTTVLNKQRFVPGATTTPAI